MVKSPCEFICTLEDGVCIGCYRTKEEIANWTKYSDEEKLLVLNKLQERKESDNIRIG